MSVQRSRVRSVQRARQIVQAARRLTAVKGSDFTTQELVEEDLGVAIQTFYKYFSSKDQVLLAVIENLVADTYTDLKQRGRDLPDPGGAPLRFCVTWVVPVAAGEAQPDAGARFFITTEHWRLHRLYPQDWHRRRVPSPTFSSPRFGLRCRKGCSRRRDPAYDAWLVTQLLIAVFHHYEYARAADSQELIAERLWRFFYGTVGGPVAAAQASQAPVSATQAPRPVKAAK